MSHGKHGKHGKILSPAEIKEIKEKEKSLKIDFIMKSQFVKFVLIRC